MTIETLREHFQEACKKHSEKRAITFFRKGKAETDISYGEVDRDACQVARCFMDHGVKRGDRVILCLQKSLITLVAHLALQKIGAISVPLNPGFKKSEISYLIEDADARLILVGPEQGNLVREIDPGVGLIEIDTRRPYQDMDFFRSYPCDGHATEISPNDPGLIIYTSGTTGRPKGTVLTQANLIHDMNNITRVWEITDKDVLCHALPLYHVHGLCFALHTCLSAGARVLLLDAFSPPVVMDLLSRKEGAEACSIFMAVPTMYGKLLEYMDGEIRDFSHMRLWTSGSAPLLDKDFKRMRQVFGKEPVEREGMSETGMNFSNPVRGYRKPGSIGLPLPGLGVRIVDAETLDDVEPGLTGEIWLKGSGITPGYWRKPGETAKAFVDGWFRTGDLGGVDNDGYYYLTDRIKNIIISGGENISPREVEFIINRIEGVTESSVVGIQDSTWGEKVVAAVVPEPRSRVSRNDIQSACQEHLHKWKCPKEIVLVDELPKNSMGKVLKEEVKKFF